MLMSRFVISIFDYKYNKKVDIIATVPQVLYIVTLLSTYIGTPVPGTLPGNLPNNWYVRCLLVLMKMQHYLTTHASHVKHQTHRKGHEN